MIAPSSGGTVCLRASLQRTAPPVSESGAHHASLPPDSASCHSCPGAGGHQGPARGRSSGNASCPNVLDTQEPGLLRAQREDLSDSKYANFRLKKERRAGKWREREVWLKRIWRFHSTILFAFCIQKLLHLKAGKPASHIWMGSQGPGSPSKHITVD